jgi:hypothetical protein
LFRIVNQLIKQNNRAGNVRLEFAVRDRLGKTTTVQGYHAHIHQNGRQARRALFGDDVRAIALFSGIGSVVALIAVSSGVQGVWL